MCNKKKHYTTVQVYTTLHYITWYHVVQHGVQYYTYSPSYYYAPLVDVCNSV